MSRFQIEAGNRFVKDGQELLVIEVQKNKHVLFEAINTGDRKIVERNEVEQQFLRGELLLMMTSEMEEALTTTPFDLLTDEQKIKTKRRLLYVEALDKEAVSVSIRSCVDEVIANVAKVLEDHKPPSVSTVRKWYRKWTRANNATASLVPRFYLRGTRKLGLCKEAQRILEEEIRKYFLVREQPTLRKIIKSRIRPRFKRENAQRDHQDRLLIPSRATIYRYVAAMDPFEKMCAREGKAAAENFFRNAGAGIRVDAPLDYVQIDHTELDVFVVAPVKGIVARPTLTVALDLYSRMPWGIYLGFAAPGYESVMLCMRNGIQAKGQFLSALPAVEGTWPCHGVPRKIILDNGLEFHSESLRDACSQLGIGMIYHPVRTPHYKGAVERFFRTVNDGFLSGLKGRTFSNIAKRGDYDPVKHTAIPFKEFYEAFFVWLVDVYSRQFHRGIQDYPVERWGAGVEKMPVDLPQKPDDLQILLGQPIRPTLQNSGIHRFNSRYNCRELGELFKRLGKSRKVSAKFDPMDLGTLYVYDDDRKKYIHVPCLDRDMHGLNKWQYGLVRKEIAALKRRGEVTYSTGTHLRRIYDMLNVPSKSGKRRPNKRAARHAENRGIPTGKADLKPEACDFFDGEFMISEAEANELKALLTDAIASGWANQSAKEA